MLIAMPPLPGRNPLIGGQRPQAGPAVPSTRLQSIQRRVVRILAIHPRRALADQGGVDVDGTDIDRAQRAPVFVRPSAVNARFLAEGQRGERLFRLLSVGLRQFRRIDPRQPYLEGSVTTTNRLR